MNIQQIQSFKLQKIKMKIYKIALQIFEEVGISKKSLSIFLSYLHAASTISKTHYLELSLCWIFYLVLSAFSLISLINPFGILNSVISNFHCVKMFSWSLQAVSHLPSWRFEWGFQMNHTVHFRHLNVNHCIDKTFFGSLLSLFFNVAQAATCPQFCKNWMWEMFGFESRVLK